MYICRGLTNVRYSFVIHNRPFETKATDQPLLNGTISCMSTYDCGKHPPKVKKSNCKQKWFLQVNGILGLSTAQEDIHFLNFLTIISWFGAFSFQIVFYF